jgi:hypothetical protein
MLYDDGGNLVEFTAGETDQSTDGNYLLKSLDKYGIYGAYEDGLAMLRGLAIHEELEEPDESTSVPEYTCEFHLATKAIIEINQRCRHRGFGLRLRSRGRRNR